MARRNVMIGAVATMSALTLAAAAAPAQGSKGVTKASYTGASGTVALAPAPAPALAPTPSLTEAEMNQLIVADFLRRKDRAEKAQRSILAELRKDLDRRRAEFEEARKRFDQARSCYSEIVGPLPRQGVMNPADPRLPYEFEVRRFNPLVGSEPSRAGQISQQENATGGAVR